MTEFVALRSKVYSYLIDGFDDNGYAKNKIINKKAKGQFPRNTNCLVLLIGKNNLR